MKIFFGATNSNKFSFEIGSLLIFADMYCLVPHSSRIENLVRSWIKGKSIAMYSHSSSTKDFIHFCICAGKCLLKSEEQKF